jgi:hypothetical protein
LVWILRYESQLQPIMTGDYLVLPVRRRADSVSAFGPNPRFIGTNLPAQGFKDDLDKTRFTPARLYEEFYCGRGEMENVLKQQTLDLQADRMSTHYLASNQLRVWLAALAYLLLERDGAGPGNGRQHPAQTLESGGASAGECAPGLCAVEQRRSAASALPDMPATVVGTGPRQRLTPVILPVPHLPAGGVSKNGARRRFASSETPRPFQNRKKAIFSAIFPAFTRFFRKANSAMKYPG